MFGYIKAHTPELKMREYEFYRAAYCGLCRANGRCTGCASRFALSYDFVFLALVRLAVSGEKVEFRQRRCMAHPLKKRNEICACETLDYCARAAAILTHHKILDDVDDERGSRRIAAHLALLFSRRPHKKAVKVLPDLDEKVKNKLRELAALEGERVASVDRPAEIFGEITADILAYGFSGGDEKILRQIGLHIGKWIYIADALDDYGEDLEKGRYHPFAVLWQDGISDESLEGIRTALTHELMQAELGFELIDYGDSSTLRGTVQNIIYLGLPRKIDDIIKTKFKREEQNSQNERSL